MKFLNNYADCVLESLWKQIVELEEHVIRKGIFATNSEKARLENLSRLYQKKLIWYEKQYEMENK